MELFAIHCTTCRARLKVHDEEAIGQILECPKCSSFVQVVPPPGWKRPAAEPARDGDAARNGGPTRGEAAARSGAAPQDGAAGRGDPTRSGASIAAKASSAAGGAAGQQSPSPRETKPAKSRASADATIAGPAAGSSSLSSLKMPKVSPPPLPPKSASGAMLAASANPPAPPVASRSIAAPKLAASVSTAPGPKPRGAATSGRFGDWRVLSAGAITGVLLAVGVWAVLASLAPKAPAMAAKSAKASGDDLALTPSDGDRPTASDAALSANVGASSSRSPNSAPSDAASNSGASGQPASAGVAGGAANGATPTGAAPKFANPIAGAAPDGSAGQNGAAPTSSGAANGAVGAIAPASRPSASLPAANPPIATAPLAASGAAPPASGAAPAGLPGSTAPAGDPKNARAAMKPAPEGRLLDAALGNPAEQAPRATAPASDGIDTATRAAIETRLEDKLPSVEFTQATLREFVDFISEFSTIDIVIDREALAKQGKGPQTPIAVRLKNVTVAAALKAALARHGLVAVVRGDKLVVTTAGAGP